MTDPDRVKDLIDLNASLRDLALACESKVEAFTLFARAMQARYPLERTPAATECELCHRAPASGDCQVSWRAVTHDEKQVSRSVILLLLGHFRTAGRITVTFLTHHPCCDACRRKLWWRVWLTRTGKVLLFLPIVLAILALLVSLLWLAIITFTPSDKSQVKDSLVFSGECVAALAVLYLLYRGLSSVSAPEALRHLAKAPFEPIGVRRAR